jgi:ubiquinol-cytochrome c reductase cytochrome b subunit
MTPFLVLYALLVVATARQASVKLITVLAVAALVGGFFVVEAKFWGVVAMGAAVLVLFALPWIDNSPVRSIRYRPGWHKWVYGLFVVVFVVLGYLGVKPPEETLNLIAKIGTLLYFAFFMLMPWWSAMGEFKTVPDRVTFAAH